MKKLLLVSLCFLFYSLQIFAQNRTVTGTVTAKDDGLPLPGVSVKVTGTTIGTQTSSSGAFSLSVPASAKSLTFSFIGYEDQQVAIGSGVVKVALVVGSKQLSEVVVVGYGTTTKQAYVGSAKAVSGEELDKKRVDNVAQALAGEVAGVRVINTSGQPGTVATIRIRGFGSINGNRDPLYVVDGVPYSGSINAINMADVESTTVLKDAVATAIYGSRGSAGVVLITTKSGKNKKPYVEADVNFGTNAQLIPRYSVIKSPEQFIALAWEAVYNQGVGSGNANPTNFANTGLFSATGIDPSYNIWNVSSTPSIGANLIDPTTRTVKAGVTRLYDPERWSDNAFQHAARTEANVRLGGGTDKTGYYMSLGYLDDKGYSIASDYRRLNGRVNLTSEIKPWLNAAMNLNYANSKQNVGGQTSDSGSIFWFVDNIPPIYGVYLRDPATGAFVPDPIFGGNQFDYGDNRAFGALTNSIADTKYNTNRNDRDEINGNVSLNAKIIDGLTFENTFGVQYYNLTNVQRTNKFYGSAASQNGSIFLHNQTLSNYDLLDLLRYKKKISDNNFEVLAAHEATKWTHSDQQDFKYNLILNDLETLNNAVVSTPASQYIESYSIDSYFGQINYDYKEKYYLSGSIRRDGSSRFVNNKWGTFGSIGASWLISSEDFMKSQSIVNNLKLKASYGVIGDQSGVGLYPGYTLADINNVNDQPGIPAPTQIGNPDLTWETSKMSQVGVEFGIGKYLTGSIDYYIKNTTNLIFDRRVPISAGYATFRVNDGKLRNSGLEFDLTAHVLKAKDYHFEIGVNGEFLKNEITAMPIDPANGQPQVLSPQGNYGWAQGHSIYDFYSKQYAGVNPANGNSRWQTYWVDLNGDGVPATGTIEQGAGGEYIASLGAFQQYVATHQSVAGINKPIQQTTTETYTNASLQFTGQSAVPTVRGAFNLSGGYKNFDLSVQVLYSLGGYAYDSAYATLMGDAQIGDNNWSTDILNRWQKAGDVTDVPRLSNAQNLNVTSNSSRFITKADYLALNNVRLSYTFGKDLLSKIGVAGLSIWASGDNLWLATKRKGFNPTTSQDGISSIYTYNPLSTFSAGIKAKF